jgi:hypothetical protein
MLDYDDNWLETCRVSSWIWAGIGNGNLFEELSDPLKLNRIDFYGARIAHQSTTHPSN